MRATAILVSFAAVVTGAACAQGSRADVEVPPSIHQMCERPPNSVLICEDLQEFLDAMNDESRDDAWATAMEARIRKAMQVDGKEVRRIRTLQCRETRCVLIYQVPSEHAAHQIDGDLALDETMDLRTGTVADDGALAIGMMAWQKRVTLLDTAPSGYERR